MILDVEHHGICDVCGGDFDKVAHFRVAQVTRTRICLVCCCRGAARIVEDDDAPASASDETPTDRDDEARVSSAGDLERAG